MSLHGERQHSMRAKSLSSGARLHLLLFNRHRETDSTHHLPSTILSAFQILIRFCLTTTLLGGYYHRGPPFLWWNQASKRWSHGLEITAVSHTAWTHTPRGRLQSSWSGPYRAVSHGSNSPVGPWENCFSSCPSHPSVRPCIKRGHYE